MPAGSYPLGNRTSISYNANGQQISVEDANGHRTTTVFDSASQPIAEINALGNRTTTMYDAVGNTTALIDARGNRHSFLYDADDRETALIDPLSRRTTTGYLCKGQCRRAGCAGHCSGNVLMVKHIIPRPCLRCR